jgi:hypothetical protein
MVQASRLLDLEAEVIKGIRRRDKFHWDWRNYCWKECCAHQSFTIFVCLSIHGNQPSLTITEKQRSESIQSWYVVGVMFSVSKQRESEHIRAPVVITSHPWIATALERPSAKRAPTPSKVPLFPPVAARAPALHEPLRKSVHPSNSTPKRAITGQSAADMTPLLALTKPCWIWTRP